MKSRELTLDDEKASLADISYDNVLTMALTAYKDGEIKQFRGKPHGEIELFSCASYLEPLFGWDPLQCINA